VAVGFGLEFFLQPAAHPFATFDFHGQLQLAQGARAVCFRDHPNSFRLRFRCSARKRCRPHYTPFMVVVSNCAPGDDTFGR
jgi:hypothetical protein